MKKFKCDACICFWAAVGGTFLTLALAWCGYTWKQSYAHRVILSLHSGDIVLNQSSYYLINYPIDIREDDGPVSVGASLIEKDDVIGMLYSTIDNNGRPLWLPDDGATIVGHIDMSIVDPR